MLHSPELRCHEPRYEMKDPAELDIHTAVTRHFIDVKHLIKRIEFRWPVDLEGASGVRK